MANQDDLSNQHVSLFPLPPWQLIEKYTDSNVSQGLAPGPPQLMKGVLYKMFGSFCNTDDPILKGLEYHHVKRVYPLTYNIKREIRKINFSLLANYLDLLDIMTKDPLSPKRMEKTEEIGILFINMHHLVNEYRPFQAKDLLKEILKYQVEVSAETRKRADEYLVKSKTLLNDVQKELDEFNEQLTLEDLDQDIQQYIREIQSTRDLKKILGESGNSNLPDIAESCPEKEKNMKIDIDKDQVTELFDPLLWQCLNDIPDESIEMC